MLNQLHYIIISSNSMRKSLSIIIPALNEEKNLEKTINEIKKGINNKLDNYEILIFDDGSTDNTGKLAELMSKKDDKIRVIHNKPNRGMGYCYKTGQKHAKFEYYMYVPADNQFPGYALKLMVDKLGNADIVIPYVTNMGIRPVMRRIISASFTLLLNFLFGLNLKYYNAPVIHKLKILRNIPQSLNSGHAYQAEILIRAIKAGTSYIEVGYDMYERKGGKTTAFKWRSAERVLSTIILLFWQLQILKKPPQA